MTLQEQFTQILKEEQKNAVLPFLQKLDNAQKKELVPAIKKLVKEYYKYVTVGLSWQSKGTETQIKLLQLAAFVCMNRKDYEKVDPGAWIFATEEVNHILDWYCPSWLNDFINSFAQHAYISHQLNYQWLMRLQEKGFLNPAPELIVKVFPQLLFEFNKNERIFKPQNLYISPLTLKEHIWYVFQYESSINWENRFYYHNAPKDAEEQTWIHLLVKLAKNGELSRSRLIKEAILATTRNFNKSLSGWFTDLLIELEPTSEELLEIQTELFNTFHSPHSKPINATLKFLKKLSTEEQFDLNGFLENAFILITSETKSIVNSTLIILEKLGRRYKNQTNHICELACQAFIHHDDALQSRAAKIIHKYGNAADEALQQTILQYDETMYASAKHLLKDFMPAVTEVASSAPETILDYEEVSVINDANKIQPIECFDELIFLASQAFDNNQSFHFDLLPAALIQLSNEIKGENIAKLEPAFQRAYKLMMMDWRNSLGFLDHMLANFFVDYGQYLVKKFPVDANAIYLTHKAYVKQDKENKWKWSFYDYRIESLKEWRTHSNNPIYTPFKSLLLEALDAIHSGHGLPLLSTPTHTPSWIDPVVLVERLSQYQQKGIKPGEADWQIAISRTALEDTADAIALTHEKLEGEYKRIMLFLLDKESRPKGPFLRPAIWMTAAVTKAPATLYHELEAFSWQKFPRNYFNGQITWSVTVEDYYQSRYDYNKRKYVKVKDTRKDLKLDTPDKSKLNGLNRIINKFIPLQTEPDLLIYHNLYFKADYLYVEYNDIRRYFSLLPNNPDPLLILIIKKSLKNSTFWEEGDKRLVIAALEALLDLSSNYGKIAYLFIATCMLCSDKTARAIAAEIWIKGVCENTINSEWIGNMIGEQEKVEFAPLKRFTDLLIDQMFLLSDQHNRALEELLTACLEQLPEQPIKNLKKLLEIYREILLTTGTDMTGTLAMEKIENWKSVGSLKRVISTMESCQMV